MLSGMTTPATELHPCACGDPECDKLTSGTYARGHYAKARKFGNPQPDLLPGPDDDLDIGILDLDARAPAGPSSDDAPAPPEPSPPEPPADDEVIRPLGFPPPGKGKPGKAPRGAVRVTAAGRKDVAAKLQLMLFVPGQVWATRDPYCGGTFVQQLPDTVDALTDIICDSADLYAFFTGPGGSFMKYLKLILALQPVGVVAWQHHIAHAITDETSGQPQPDMAQYAA